MGVFRDLYETYRSAYQYLQERLGPLGLSPLEAQILVWLETHRSAPLAEIRQRFRLSGSSLHSVLNRLETAGLVERHRPCADRRSACVGLTSVGRAQAPQLREILVELDVRIYAHLPPDQLVQMRRGLNSIQFAVDQAPATPVAQPIKVPA